MVELYKREIHTGLAVLRILACIGVVCLHSFGAIGKVDSKLSYIIWYGCTFSIPIFFALSGYFTLGRLLTYKQALKKIIGIVRLMLAWFILIAVYGMIATKSFYNPICDFGLSFFQKGSLPRYWYFWDLMILIFITPFIEQVFNTEKRQWIFFMTLIGACLGSNAVNLHSIISGGIPYTLMMCTPRLDRHIRYGYS